MAFLGDYYKSLVEHKMRASAVSAAHHPHDYWHGSNGKYDYWYGSNGTFLYKEVYDLAWHTENELRNEALSDRTKLETAMGRAALRLEEVREAANGLPVSTTVRIVPSAKTPEVLVTLQVGGKTVELCDPLEGFPSEQLLASILLVAPQRDAGRIAGVQSSYATSRGCLSSPSNSLVDVK